MRAHSYPLKSLAFASVLLVVSSSAFAQSAYFQAMTNLNPIVYFPLQETTQPPIADVETNYGSLGPSANAIYSGHNMAKGGGGATADGDTSANDSDAWGGFCAVPTTDTNTAVASPTLTVEAWVNPAETGRNFEGIVAKSGGNTGGIRGSNNQAGWCLSENYLAYLDSANMIGFDFHVYNGAGHGGAEVIVPFNVQANTWYHLVATYDGTNCWLYINGTNMIATGAGYQIPMSGSYVPDTWNPLQIGSSRNLNGNNYHGNIDEVAIYTNVLSPARILAHYNAAFVASPYSATILADNPYMYWRMDSLGYTAPTFDTYPSATNYGTYASSFGAAYGTASQPGVPGPQFSGMLDPNNGNASYAVAINGIGGNNGNGANVPVGYDGSGNPQAAADAAPIIVTNLSFSDPNGPLLNPTNGPGKRQPFSVTIWFKANPHDWSRFQTIFGHSDSGWRMSMNTTGIIQWNPGPGGEVGTALSYDDGNWHQFVGTYDGTNVLTYVDGAMVVATTTTANGNGSALFPILGGDPFYLDSGNAYAAGNGGTGNTTYRQRNFSGSIAHFAFFTNTLSAAQVETLFSSAVTNQAPFIVGQPVTGRVNPRPPTFLFFGVAAVGSGPLSYQWYFNAVSNYSGATQLVDDGVKYAGSTTTQVTVSNLVAGDSGYYFVIITNDLGSVTSRLASLVVNYTPVITAQNPAANFSLFPGQITTLSVTATADTNGSVGPLSFYWFTNSVFDSTGGTGANYNLGPVAGNNNGESFFCIVSNSAGTATSAPVTLTVVPFPAALTNSPFSSNLLQLGPTAYWPMHDVGQTPVAPLLETNYGSLGAIANAYWDDWRQPVNALAGNLLGGGVTNDLSVLHDFPSAIAGDPDPSVQLSGANRSYVVIPRIPPFSPNSSPANFTLQAPFTLEAWVKPYNNRGFGVMLSTDQGTINGGSVRGGFNWLYSGTANSFSITVFNGTNGNSTEPKTSANYPPGYWYHVVTTFDGTNVQYYINGVADPMTGAASTAATLNPNTWDPITIGCGRGLNANVFQGGLDEVVVYTNLLSVIEIQKHYNDGTNAAYANYKQDVLENHPWLYYRMDSPNWSLPPTSTWPVLTNFGKIGLNGIYTPGSIPGGGPGPSDDGVPVGGLAAGNSLQQNGCSIFADALNSTAYHPSTFLSRTPVSAAAWVKGDPANTGSQNWQGFVAQGDGAYRLNMNSGNPRANFNPGGAGGDSGNSTTTGTSANINDGNWHYVVGTYDGTNTVLYVDGLVSASNSSTGNIQSTNAETFIGAYPANSVPSSTPNSLANEAGRVFAGSICEAAYWNGTALKAGQVQTLYSSLHIAPVIAVQPALATTVNGNGGFTNKVVASGSAPFSYQWYYAPGVPLPQGGQTNLTIGATNASLIIFPAKPSDDGSNYFVVVSNPYGSVTSAVWSLNVLLTSPIITNDIVNTNVQLFPGGHASFSILAVGELPLAYQWYSNNVAISGATGSSFTLQNAQPPSSVQNYYCVVSNAIAPMATSRVAQVTVLAFPGASYPATVISDSPVAYWRLNENPDLGGGNNGTVAFDSFGGYNGIYTNANINQFPGYNTLCEPTQPSVAFGLFAFSNSMVFNVPTNLDFATTSSATLSVECWANGFAQSADAGIVSKGTGGGGEEFNLDTGSGGHAFRFFVRTGNAVGATAAGTAIAANSTNKPDGAWHHLVGVCDQVSGNIFLYVDGVLAGSNSIPPGSGIVASLQSVKIGSRPSDGTAVANTNQFVGNISDVSLYNYALTRTQVENHYFAACIPAQIVAQPTNATASEGGNASFSATVTGTPVLSNQWFIGSPGSGTPIIGANNTTLVLSNLDQSTNAYSFYLETANAYATNDSTTVQVNVIAGAPQITANVPPNLLVIQGGTVSIPVAAYGTLPLNYQWQMGDTNGQNLVNLSDNGRIAGSHSNTLTISAAQLSDTGTYQVGINNIDGSATSGQTLLLVVPPPLGFFGNGEGWAAHDNGTLSTSAFNSGVLTLTDNANNETRSAFFTYPQYIVAFKASFVYRASGGNPTMADGMAFCLQNDSRGTAALGGGGGSLAVSGINPSWELELNVFPNNTVGYAQHINGATGGYTAAGNVALASGDPIQVNLFYAQTQMSLTFTDLVAGTTFSTNINVGDLTSTVNGQTAYVGFTGATGGSASTQTISNFAYVGVPTAAITRASTNSAVVTWPGTVGGYTLMQSPSLSAPSWTPVTNLDSVVNGKHQVIVPTTGATNQFYRLSVPF